MNLDLRYALRRLVRSRGFTLAAALTIAIGVGANTAIFTLVNAVLLRPPVAVAEPERLVGVYTSDYSGPPFGTSSLPDVEEFGKQTDIFAGVIGFAPRPAAVGEDDNLERIAVEVVTDNYFQVLGVQPVAGRAFGAEQRTPGGEPVAIISHALWQRRFGGDAAIVGKPLRLNARQLTIIGVAPPRFAGSLRALVADAWVPVSAAGAAVGMDASVLTSRGDRGTLVYARLRPGVTIDEASARMSVVARQLATAYPDAWRDVTRQGRRITLVPEAQTRVPPQARGPALGFVALLMGTVALVLLVCCANVAGLLLARAAGRLKEVGIRVSLGASRARIVRQMLTESVLLAALGGIVGAAVAVWAGRVLMTVSLPLPVPVALDLTPDARVLTFTLAVTILTGVVFGLAPALRASRADVVTALKVDTPALQLGARRFSLQGALVVGQVALSLLLVVGALLFMQTLRAAASIDPGFRVDHMLMVDIAPRPGTEERTSSQQVALAVRDRVAALPGVTAVSWANSVPLGLEASRRHVRVEGYEPPVGEDMEFHYSMVGPRYFETMETPLVRGRGFTDADRMGAPRVVVVNEAFARRFWGDADPIGKRLSSGGPEGSWMEVIGLARDGKYVTLAESPRPYVFYPQLQMPSGVTLLVRTSGEPMDLAAAVRREVATVSPDWLTERASTVEEHIGVSLLPQRIAAGVLGAFGTIALLLAAVGLYGVVAFAVAQRTREIGIRVALGARSGEVLRLMLRQGLVLAGIGLAVGLPIAFAAARLLSGFLLGGGTTDPLVFLLAAAALAAVTLMASWIPARRAARVDPMVALRAQ